MRIGDAVAMAAVVLAAALVLGCGKDEQRIDLEEAPAVQETQQDRVAGIQEAFGSPRAQASLDDAAGREIQAHLDSLRTAVNASDAARAADHFDFELLVRRIIAYGELSDISRTDRRDLATGIRRGAEMSWFDPVASGFRGDSIRVTALELNESGNIALAYTRTDLDGEGSLLKMRWWLARTGGSWSIYDVESLNIGIRQSVMTSSLLARTLGGRPPAWLSSLQLINQAELMAEQGNAAGAVRLLRGIDARPFPTDMQAVHANMLSYCLSEIGEYAEALEYAEHALLLKSDFPQARYWRGVALLNLYRYEEALEDLQWFNDALGSDPSALTLLGNCLTWLDRHQEARDAYLQSLEDTVTWPAIAGLAVCIYVEEESPDYQILEKYFLRLRHPQRDYSAIAFDLWDNHYIADAVAVINRAYRTLDPEDIDLEWYTAQVALYHEDWGKAAKVLRTALNNAPEDRVDEFLYYYYWSMVEDGRAIEALKEAGNSREAFESLCDHLYDSDEWDDMVALCDAWAEGNESDPMLHYYRGLAELGRDNLEEALTLFSRSSELEPVEGWLINSLRHNWTDALYRLGRIEDAYNTIEPTEEVFRLLVERMTRDEAAEDLKALTATHAEAHPDCTELLRARGELAWLQGEWETAAAQLHRYYASREFASWTARERIIRAAVRGGNTGMVERWTRHDNGSTDHYLLCILLVGADRHSEAIQSLISLAASHEDDEFAQLVFDDLYADEDIGEKLRGPEYARIHERLPPSPELESEDD
jgi:predicted Zn-dependent protease